MTFKTICRFLLVCVKGRLQGWSLRAIAPSMALGMSLGMSLGVSLGVSLAVLLGGCVTSIPVDEYTIARAAYEAAKDADAPRYAPALWFSAEQMYRDAIKNFRDRRYEKAQASFIQAKNLAEQAENVARLARYQSGEIAP